MTKAADFVSRLIAYLLGSLRFVIAAELVLLLLWSLIEMAIAVRGDSEYRRLAWFLIAAIVGAFAFTVWRWRQPQAFGNAPAGGSLNLLPLTLLVAGLLLAAVYLSDTMKKPFAASTPLLHLSQVLIHKLMS
jgi:uncharacterized membrane protein YedE/YeeE